MAEKNDAMLQFIVDLRQACDAYIESVIPAEFREEKKAVTEEKVFTCLTFEPHHGEKLGDYETAQVKNNTQGQFDQAFNILKATNATIKTRYHEPGYVYSYWLYFQALLIYRQRLKAK